MGVVLAESNPIPIAPDQAEADALVIINDAGWAVEFNASSVIWHLKQHILHGKYFALIRARWHYNDLNKLAEPYNDNKSYENLYRGAGPAGIRAKILWAARVLYQLNKILTDDERILLTQDTDLRTTRG